jgi:glycosyltransferase involved in cell wall biosynthesis
MTRLRGPAQGSRNVTFAGALQPNDVDAWLARASVFVMPSIGLAGQSEGLPRAVMEAMAAGLPIVASRTGGIPEIVQDGKGGLLVQPSDADALARALIEILSHPMKAKAMGAYNRAAIESRSFPRVEQQVTQLFERLAKK